jgi:coproporphyrinogen III oxidase-like Fe-S oxidoreductase
VFPHIDDLRNDGLLECRDEYWRLTARGLLLADSVFATFL